MHNKDYAEIREIVREVFDEKINEYFQDIATIGDIETLKKEIERRFNDLDRSIQSVGINVKRVRNEI